MTRILIADDHAVVRSGLKSILEAHDGWNVVAEASDGKEAVSKAVETKPDVAIIDYSLPIMSGLEATRQIRLRLPEAEVLIGEVLQAGAQRLSPQDDAQHYLISAVESLSVHKPFFAGKLSEKPLKKFLAVKATPRRPPCRRASASSSSSLPRAIATKR
jgi:DNA-binding NarL/FixJ family response regulator